MQVAGELRNRDIAVDLVRMPGCGIQSFWRINVQNSIRSSRCAHSASHYTGFSYKWRSQLGLQIA